MTPFEARIDRRRTVLQLLVGLAIAAFGVWRIFDPDDQIRVALGWAFIVCIGLLLIRPVKCIVTGGVEIRIDADGIYARRWSDRTIPWKAIARITLPDHGKRRYASVFLTDVRASPLTTPSGRLRISRITGGGDIMLSVALTDQSTDAMMTAIDRFAPPGTVR